MTLRLCSLNHMLSIRCVFLSERSVDSGADKLFASFIQVKSAFRQVTKVLSLRIPEQNVQRQ